MSKRVFEPQVHEKEYDKKGKALQLVTNRAFEKFRPKSYAEKWKPTLSTLNPLLYVMQAFAVFLAGYFIASVVFSKLNFGKLSDVLISTRTDTASIVEFSAIAIMIGCTFLFITLERVKAKSFFAYIYGIFTQEKKPFNLMLVPVILISCASIFTTIGGGQRGGKDVTKDTKSLDVLSEAGKHDRNTDADLLRLNKRFDKAEKDHGLVLNRKGAYNNSPYTWKGNSTKYRFNELARLEKEMKSLSAQILERSKEIDGLYSATLDYAKDFNEKESSRFESDLGKNTAIGLGFSISLEIGILLLLYFISRIESEISKETRKVNNVIHARIKRQSYELKGFNKLDTYAIESEKLPIQKKHIKKLNPSLNKSVDRAVKSALSESIKSDQSKPTKSAQKTAQKTAQSAKPIKQKKASSIEHKIEQEFKARGINKIKYKKLLRWYEKIPLKKDGKPNISALSNKTGITRNTISKYITLAIELNHIKS